MFVLNYEIINLKKSHKNKISSKGRTEQKSIMLTILGTLTFPYIFPCAKARDIKDISEFPCMSALWCGVENLNLNAFI